MSEEIWKIVPIAEMYEASSSGRIRQVYTHRVISQSKTKDGYWRVNIFDGIHWRSIGAARLVCMAFHGMPPSEVHQTAHENGVRTDNVPTNLSWKTPKQNMDDRERHGNAPHGERCGLARLSESDVQIIRAEWVPGRGRFHRGNSRELSERFGVGLDTIWQVARGKTWGHAPNKRPPARRPNGSA